MRVLILLLLAIPASAQVTYTYTGPPLTVTQQQGSLTGITILTQITGSVSLAQPLAPNQANQVVVPLSYSLGGFNSTANNDAGPQNPPPAFFSFTTLGGQIIAWNVSLFLTRALGAAEGVIEQFASSWAADIYTYTTYWIDCPLYATCAAYDEVSYVQGSWTFAGGTPLPPPPVDPLQAQLTAAQAQVADLQADP